MGDAFTRNDMTPTQRSLEWCRKQGGLVAVVERWNPHARIRQDLFGFADILWVKGDTTTLIQTTTTANMAARIQKILNEPRALEWLASYSRTLSVHGWSKRGPRGKRKVWVLRQVSILKMDGLLIPFYPEDLPQPTATPETPHHD